MELLAPVGNIENFHAALKSGADAVYVGAPGFNARSLSRDLRLEDIAAMIDYCRERDKKFYIAANSLLLEKDLPSVIENLAVLDGLEPDALIVQDFGLIRLVHQYFPELVIHGSTLTTAHNSQAVEVMGNFGCDRVVLARELTLKEIETIAARNKDIELEIFIHGAMCFSYSGLCLFSSFLGGKSGLRGKCVQPCRRAYRTPRSIKGGGSRQKGGARNKQVQGRGKQPVQGGKAEYLFSMNDLSGLEAIPKLKQIGIASLKVEGRLRSARYIENVISAYRLMIDALPHEQESALSEAQNLIDKAMSRKTSSGYFFSPQPVEAISHLHSGNMGLHLGRVTKVDMKAGKPTARLKVKEPVAVGDRIRLHIEPGGERLAFSVKELNNSDNPSTQCNTGDNALILLPEDIKKYRLHSCDLYKVDDKGGVPFKSDLNFKDGKTRVSILKKKLFPLVKQAHREVVVIPEEMLGEVYEDKPTQLTRKKPGKQRSRGRVKKGDRRGPEKNLHKELKMPMEWWLRLDSAKTILTPLPFTPDRFVLAFEPSLIRQAVQIKRYLGRNARQVMWALPPLIAEKDLGATRKNIQLLIASGFRTFQVAHMSQIELFGRERVHLYGDYSLNMLNAQSLLLASQVGFEGVQLSMETDRENLFNTLAAYREISSVNKDDDKVTRIPVGLTVYGTPPLYTARLASSFHQFDKTIISPKDESFVMRKKQGYTQTFPTKPFSLLPYLSDLKNLGINYAVVDLTGSQRGGRPIEELAERLAGNVRGGKLPTFNYLGTLA